MGGRLRRGAAAFGRLVWDLPARWRRSIQFRVVSVTMALSIAVAAGLGFFIAQQVAKDILNTREEAAAAQATSGFSDAREYLASSGSTTDPGEVGKAANRKLCAGSAGEQYQVAMKIMRPEQVNTSCGNLYPASLKPLSGHDQGVDAGSQVPLFYDVTYETPSGQTTTELALVYGEQITTDDTTNPDASYRADVYFTFPLSQDQQTLSDMEQAIGVAGLVLVFALMGIAYFVTRQVVLPVRMAASTAERLAAGRLEVRMRTKGTDDLASLASSFNNMADNLQAKIKEFEELSRVQRRFVSDVSHELRTPLTTVRMAADLIFEDRASFEPAVSRSAELLQDQLDRFEELLADLLEISRFDAGAAVLDAEPVDLRDLAQRVVDNARPLAEHKGSVVVIDAPQESCTAEVDTRRIDRVLRNLVVNAIEHGEGRPIVVRIAVARDAVAVAVRDHGVGLRPGESSLVFNRFWRADPARARTTGGTGLGLAIALEDARLHHGWLQAWGEPGGGSQFRLTLPRTTGAELLRSPIPLEPEDSSHHQRRAGRSGGDGPGTGGRPAIQLGSAAAASRPTTAVPWFDAGSPVLDDRLGEDK
ncbi:MAG TPA: MtrAB system histidine kinase MtrB [Actinocrinis sp.]|nr:MtrAB system histidine kinase MtrB [Actinocrinis sp.]